jgi:ABC-2 type transport system permease protein
MSELASEPSARRALVRAELGKLRTVRSTWVLAALAVVSCVAWTVAAVALFDTDPAQAAASPEQRLVNIYLMGQQGYLFVLILGALGMTGEYRHQTIGWAFLVSPARGRVLVAKAAAHLLVGLAIGLAGALATAVCAAALLTAAGKDVFSAQVPLVLLGCVLSTAAYGLLGLAVGALVRNQAAAVAVCFGWFFYAEFLLLWFLPPIGRWLPSGAAKAMVGWQPGSLDLLPAWAGAALLVGYVVVIAAAARLVTLRRDVC